MAYDDYNDYDDGLDIKKVFKEAMQEMGKEMQQQQQTENTRRMQQDTQEVIRGFCGAAGISEQEFQQMVNADPQATHRDFLESVKHYAERVSRRARDPKTGRFVSGTQRPQRRQPEPAGEYISNYDYASKNRPAARGRRGTTDEVISRMDALLS